MTMKCRLNVIIVFLYNYRFDFNTIMLLKKISCIFRNTSMNAKQ